MRIERRSDQPSRFKTVLLLIIGSLFLTFPPAFTKLAHAQEPLEKIRIESDLVDLKVSILARNPQFPVHVLKKEDFKVFEDGVPQEIAFFAPADTAFDLVLMLDLSASTSKKLKMIKQSAKRFIDQTRDVDRVAVVTFTDRLALLSDFTLNRTEIKDQIDKIKRAFGGTNFWDAMNYVLCDLIPANQGLRRSAIVVMSDGVDNALPDVPGPGSKTTFNELIAHLRMSESIVFPIYLDTEEDDVKRYHMPRSAYAQARVQLEQIASESGSNLYRASKLKDLDQLYSRVLLDLSTVYGIGYRPARPVADGSWRSVVVKLIGRPELSARTRKGYYARAPFITQ